MSDTQNPAEALLAALLKAASTPPAAPAAEVGPLLAERRRSPGFAKVLPDLIAARDTMRPLKASTPGLAVEFDQKTRQTTRRTYHYADLAEILDVVTKPLLDAGFLLTQSVGRFGAGDVLITELLHASGEWMASYTPIILNPEDPQRQAASITSAKRSAIPTLLGLAAEQAGKTEVEWQDRGEIRSAGVDQSTGEGWEGAMAVSDAPFDGGEPVNGASAPESVPKVEERPAPAPPLQLDYDQPGNRKVALAALRKIVSTAAKGGDRLAAEEAWSITYAPLIAKLPPQELEIAVDEFRRKLEVDPPPVAGVTYPAFPNA